MAESSWAHFDYMHCAEMRMSDEQEIQTWVPQIMKPVLKPLDQQNNWEKNLDSVNLMCMFGCTAKTV